MEKKDYLAPDSKVFSVAPEQMIAFSGGSPDGIIINSEADVSSDDNRSRSFLDSWSSEEMDEEF